jgi:HPt (histidine-containing phosphotransfer) domain-containing protein
LTANAVSGMREMFLSNGFNGFISKPIVMQELDTILREWLSPEKVTNLPKPEKTDTEASFIEASFIEAVKKIGEINTEIGQRRSAGMEDIYRHAMYMFHKNMLKECDTMTAFLQAQDLNNFMISVHAMKSSLATIGAIPMSEVAAALENASRNKDLDTCVQMFAGFREQLVSLHGCLSAVFPETEDPAKKGPGDMRLLQEKVQKALAAAKDFDSDTGMETIKEFLPYDFGDEINILLKDAYSAFENFEYKGAAEILSKI